MFYNTGPWKSEKWVTFCSDKCGNNLAKAFKARACFINILMKYLMPSLSKVVRLTSTDTNGVGKLVR